MVVLQIIIRVHQAPERYTESHGEREVLPPSFCVGCGKHGRLHRHGFYERYLSGLQERFRVARFLCPECGRTTSLLPSFALPYLHVRISCVEAFMAGKEADADVQRHLGLLRSYRKRFFEWSRELAQTIGFHLGRWELSSASVIWNRLMKNYGELAEASRQLLATFGVGVFGRYVVHAWARASRLGVERVGWMARFDSG